jgi:elongation factor P
VISTAEFRNGSPLMVEGQPFYIVEFQHVKPGKGGAFVRTKLKSYLSGNVLDRTFRSGEKFDTPQIEECDMQFLYATNDSYTFMDTETYEQSTYEKSQLGSNADLLKENMIAKILIYEHRPITVLLPNFIELKVVDGEPGVRGRYGLWRQQTGDRRDRRHNQGAALPGNRGNDSHRYENP